MLLDDLAAWRPSDGGGVQEEGVAGGDEEARSMQQNMDCPQACPNSPWIVVKSGGGLGADMDATLRAFFLNEVQTHKVRLY